MAALALLLAARDVRAAPDPRCPGPSLAGPATPPASAPWTDASLDPDARADLLAAQMSLEEKADLATGERCLLYGYFDAPIARLGIPALTMTDGPAGVRIPWSRVNGGRATLLPSPIALAASWDPALARLQGDVLGAEAFATGHNVVLGPTLDVARWPLAGRTFEGFGEDPLLASRIGVPFIRGVQAHPVLATAKHFAAYAQETARWSVDARLDDRTLHEVYLRPFAAAVRDGEVGAVMCAFNRVDGTSACENRSLLRDVLDGELGFRGFVLSDWAAIHGTVAAALAGLDLEMAFEEYFGHALVARVRSGELPQAVVDEQARRILRPMFRFGLFDHPPVEAPLPEAEHAASSQAIAEGSAVLLKNDPPLLPLSGAVRSIAVLGPDAASASAEGGGAARVEPTSAVGPLEGLRRRAGPSVKVAWAEGGDPVAPAHLLAGPPAIPSSVLAPPGAAPGEHGLRGEYWIDRRFEGAPDLVRTDRQVALSAGFFAYQSVNASSVAPLPDSWSLARFAARWTGTLTAPLTGDYTLTLTSRGSGSVALDGAVVIDGARPHPLGARPAIVHLAAGEPHALRVEYVADGPEIGVDVDVGGDVVLGWEGPPGAAAAVPAVRAAAALAAASDVAVVVVRDYGTEERDRPDLALPNGQDALVAAVAAANSRTVVVLQTGQPVSMPWLEAVPAVLEAWYPGQEGGDALARLLFGDVDPSGKLPIGFPRSAADLPAPALPASDGTVPVLAFSEGPLVGYRWLDARGADPLFPFGHGLSYTSFDYRDLEVHPASAGAPARVAFTLRNAGARAGAEVAQVYVGSCPEDAPQVPRRLAGFAKVALEPGEDRRVSVELDAESLATWSPDAHGWRPAACDLPLAVAASSRDVRLRATLPPPGSRDEAPGGGGYGGAPDGGATAAGGGGEPDAGAPQPGAARGVRSGGCASSGEDAAVAGAAAFGAVLFARRRRRVQRGAGHGPCPVLAPGEAELVPARAPAPVAPAREGGDALDRAPLDVRVDPALDAVVARLARPSLDAECARELRRVVGEAARGRSLVVLSLEGVREADCSGLAGLVIVLKRLAPGGEVRLAGAPARVRHLLAETRLDEVFRVFPDVRTALARPPALEEASAT